MLDSNEYLRSVGEPHRKRFGQYFTPPQVADFMVEWASGSGLKSMFDPAFGLGAFHGSAARLGITEFGGCEVDSRILQSWDNERNGSAGLVEHTDYLLSWNRRPGNIVCNPPHMRFQRFVNRKEVGQAFEKNLSMRLPGYTNSASAFLLKSLSELNGSGRLAYIMPLEFLNTGYGRIVKERLISGRHLRAVISIQCEKEVFPDAITSAGIILYDAARTFDHVDFHVLSSISRLQEILKCKPVNRVPASSLDPRSKWLAHFSPGEILARDDGLVPLSFYGRFHRGIATGANKFFALRPSQAKDLKLNSRELLPCVTKCNQIQKSFFAEADYEELARLDQPVLLFSANAAGASPQAREYIGSGESKGYHLRYLTRTRSPWYKTEERQPSPLLMGVFSRNGYKVVRNTSDAITLTCFHGFQPNLFGGDYVDRIFLFLLSGRGRAIVSRSKRQYGDGLEKFEPGDMNGVLVPSAGFLDAIDSQCVEDAMACVKSAGALPQQMESTFEALG